MDNSDVDPKIRGLFLAVLMIVSVFAGAIAFAGTAAVDEENTSDADGDDYGDAPETIQDGALDYQDYKEAGCPYLDGSLDQRDMEKCNEWIRSNKTVTETP